MILSPSAIERILECALGPTHARSLDEKRALALKVIDDVVRRRRLLDTVVDGVLTGAEAANLVLSHLESHVFGGTALPQTERDRVTATIEQVMIGEIGSTANVTTYEQLQLTVPPVEQRASELWLQHAAGFILFKSVRDYAMRRIDRDASPEARTAAANAVDDAIYGLMMLVDGVTGGATTQDDRRVNVSMAVTLAPAAGETVPVRLELLLALPPTGPVRPDPDPHP